MNINNEMEKMEEQRELFLHNRIPANKQRKKEGNRDSPSGKHQRSNCCREDTKTYAKISKQKFEEKMDLRRLEILLP